MDSVLVEGLAVDAIIGVLDWEREVEQTLIVDLEMAWDNRKPSVSDNVSDALDYAKVCDRVTTQLKSLQPALLETAAEAVASDLREAFGVSWLQVTIRKPGILPQARSVGVRIERGVR